MSAVATPTAPAIELTFVVERGSEATRADSRDALLVSIYPTGPTMGTRYALGEAPVVIGRGEDCTIRIDDQTVSRRHVRIGASADGFSAADLASTNGTYVNNVQVTERRLLDGDYLRVGNCIFRFLAGGNVEAEYHEEIYRLAIIDALTELHNKRYLAEFLERELSRTQRRGTSLALIFMDIDHFKRINDDLGHLAGDSVLRQVAARMRTVVRKDELLSRCGGEEFALVLPDTTGAEAVAVAERLRDLVGGEPFTYNGRERRATISLGVATTAGDESISPRELMQRADDRLYEAKSAGRDCVRA